MIRQERFWDKLADRYAASAVRNPDAYEATLDRVRHYLQPDHGVMEVGCGTGSTALRLAGGVRSYLATDLSGNMIDIARAKPETAGLPGLTFRKAAIDDAVPEAPFDVILAMNLLHLVEDLDGGLAVLKDTLKPGGLLISKSVCLGDMTRALRLFLPVLQWIGKAPFVHFLTEPDLDSRITRAGFEIVETGYYPAKPPSRFIVARRPMD